MAQDDGVGLSFGSRREGLNDTGLEQAQFLALFGQLIQEAHVILLFPLEGFLQLALVLAQIRDESLSGIQPFLQSRPRDSVIYFVLGFRRRVRLGV